MIYHATVDEDGVLRLPVECTPGTRLRVLVEEEPGSAVDTMAPTAAGPSLTGLQARIGFVREVLGAPEEEVWNDL